MRRIIFLLLFISGIAQAQTRQSGGISFTPQWNYKIAAGDTIWQFGNTLMSPQQFPFILTKWQSDQRFAPLVGGGYIQNKYGSNTYQTNAKILAGDSINTQKSILVKPPLGSLTMYNYGNSITRGFPNPPDGFAYKVDTAYHMIPSVHGFDGATIDAVLSSGGFGAIPSYSTGNIITLMWGTNEADPGSGITTSQYRAKYNALIDSLRTLKGYPSANIIILGTPFCADPTRAAYVEQYAAVDSLVAATKGVRFVENYHWMKLNGNYTLLLSDGVHFNAIGNKTVAAHIVNSLNDVLQGTITASNNVNSNQVNANLYTGNQVSTNGGAFNYLYSKVATFGTPYGSSVNPLNVTFNSGSDYAFKLNALGGSGGLLINRSTSPVAVTPSYPIGVWNGSAYSTSVDASGNIVTAGNLNTGGSATLSGTLTASISPGSANNFVVSNSGQLQYRSATQVLGDIGAQSAITFGSGAQTALGVNIGSAGSVVVNGGVLGTPSAGLATNLMGLPLTTGVTGILPVANGGTNTGTAGITAINNISGRSYAGFTGTGNLVGSISPTFTGTVGAATITATGPVTGTNFIIGTNPGSSFPLIGSNTMGLALSSGSALYSYFNMYFNGNWIAPGTGIASLINQNNSGQVNYYYAPAGSAGRTLSLVQTMEFDIPNGAITANKFNSGGSSNNFTMADGSLTSALPSGTTAAGTLNLKNYTVATLPAGTRGDIAYVTDALAPSFLTTVVGGGAVVTPVFYNGTNWVAQ